MPSFIIISNGEPLMMDWPTMAWSQATMLPALIQTAAHTMQGERPIAAAANIVFARPHELDRSIASERLQRGRSFGGKIARGCARRPKLPPRQQRADGNLSGGMPMTSAIAP